MKKIRLSIILCLLIVLSSCATQDYWKIRIEIPRRIEMDIKAYQTVEITPFLVSETAGEFDLNKELGDFFESAFRRKAELDVSKREIPVENESQLSSADFWKAQENEDGKSVYLTGTANYTEETRKALIKRAKKRYEDPFPAEARLQQRKFYTLNLNLLLVDAATGETVYKREFNETKGYDNPNQTAYFALFDLLQQVQEKLFRSVLGLKQVQERYLVIK